MANKLTEDKIKWILSVDASEAQQGIFQLSQANKKLASENKSLEKDMRALEAQGKKNGDEWKNLKVIYDQNTSSIEKNKAEQVALTKTLGIENLTMSQLRKTARDLQQQMDNTSKALHPESYNKLETELGAVRTRMNEIKTTSQGFGNSLASLPGVLGMVGQSLVGIGQGFKMFLADPVMIAITAIAGLGYGLVSLAKNSMEFGKAVSNLSALTGAFGSDLDFLKQKAKDLAIEYGKSAVEIVEAMKMVGSAKPELLSNVQALSQVTAAVLTLSKATGMELKESTDNVTTIMNQFGLSSLEADRTINVLAAGSKFGAREVDYLGEAISKVGTVANAAGLDLETTTAAMELFGEKGVKAEIAGNGFKRILVELQSDTKNYKNGVFDLNLAIDNNQKIAGNNIALAEKFGKEYFNIAQILLQNRDRFKELTQQVTGTTVAEEQMRIATDNLSGDMDKMKSSWNAFTLSLEDGQGPISNTFRSLIQWAKDSVDTLTTLTKSASQKQEDMLKQMTDMRMKDFKTYLDQSKDKVKYINDEISAERSLYLPRKKRLEELNKEIAANKELGTVQAKLDNKKLQKEADSLFKSVQGSIAYTNALAGLRASIKQDASTPDTTPTDITESDDDKKKRLKAAQDALDKANQDTLNGYKFLRNEELILQQEYDDLALAQELAFLKSKQKLQESFGEDTTKLKGEILDKEQALEKSVEKHKKDQYKKDSKTAERLMQEQIDMQAKPFDAMEQNLLNQSAAFDQNEKKRNEMAKAEYERQQKMNQVYQDAIVSFGSMLGEFIAGQEMSSAEFAKGMVLLALDVLEKQVMISVAAAQAGALASPESIATWGAAGTAKAAVMTGLIMAAFEGVKAAVSSGWDTSSKKSYAEGGFNDFSNGGFTPIGNRFSPAGYLSGGATVHKSEYVIAAPELKNPSIMAMARGIESVRKKRTSANTTNGFAQGGMNSFGFSNNEGLTSAILEMVQVFKNGIDARTVLTGQNGFNAQKKKYDKIITKATRS